MSVNEKMTAIADAIRAKTGKTDALTLDQMATEIEGITTGGTEDLNDVLTEQEALIAELQAVLAEKASGGGAADPVIEPLAITENGTYTAPNGVDGYSPVSVNVPIPDGYIVPSGTKTITENGTHDVTAYASVNVNVTTGGGGDINAFIDRSITEVNIPEGVTKIGDFAFRSCTKLTSVTLPSTLKTIGSSAFYSTKITTLDVPNGVTTINSNAYTSCTSLTTVFLPDTVTKLDTQCFRYDTKISKVTMGEGINSIGTYCFSGCSGLKAVIIRKTASVCPLSNTNAFSSSAISSKTGYNYVPSALVESYKTATNWSTYAAQIRPLVDTFADLASIDGSVYDRAWVDDEYCVYIYDGSAWAKEA